MKKVDRLQDVIKAATIHMAALERLLAGYRLQKRFNQMTTLVDVVTVSRNKWKGVLKEVNRLHDEPEDPLEQQREEEQQWQEEQRKEQ